MRRAITWLLVSLFTFAFGLAAVAFWFDYQRPAVQTLAIVPCLRPPYYESISIPCSGADFSALADLPTLDYCDLVNAPKTYDGRIVRVRATMSGFIHGTYLADKNCAGVDKAVAVFLHPALATETRQIISLARGSDYLFIPLDLIAIGRFREVVPSNQSDLLLDTAPLQFEIMRIEQVAKTR